MTQRESNQDRNYSTLNRKYSDSHSRKITSNDAKIPKMVKPKSGIQPLRETASCFQLLISTRLQGIQEYPVIFY
jgi:hypothetical protein